MDLDDLTPVTQDYLKVIWSAVEWGDPPITTTALAERFSTSRAAVSETMRRLEGLGMVHYEPYRPVTLTALGERLAISMVRRHRLIETFLAEVLGYGWEEVHDDAERLEHAASPVFLDRIDALLGHPDRDPHGDPIPAGDGHRRQPPTLTLAEAPAGRCRVRRVDDTDPDRLTRLRSLGVVPGRHLHITAEPRSVRAEPDGDTVPLHPTDLSCIRVQPDDAAPAGGSAGSR